eukprot:TRINITY_DN937_c1_g5_i3.p1 TRINITY_DN937_c1_g5~~TRINITY_DN937_c1_g5_i3.p1  ORF type:complete len:1180 (-),score=407.48 TRINITY_DN937_c1_g5_i3:892-4341(-)
MERGRKSDFGASRSGGSETDTVESRKHALASLLDEMKHFSKTRDPRSTGESHWDSIPIGRSPPLHGREDRWKESQRRPAAPRERDPSEDEVEAARIMRNRLQRLTKEEAILREEEKISSLSQAHLEMDRTVKRDDGEDMKMFSGHDVTHDRGTERRGLTITDLEESVNEYETREKLTRQRQKEVERARVQKEREQKERILRKYGRQPSQPQEAYEAHETYETYEIRGEDDIRKTSRVRFAEAEHVEHLGDEDEGEREGENEDEVQSVQASKGKAVEGVSPKRAGMGTGMGMTDSFHSRKSGLSKKSDELRRLRTDLKAKLQELATKWKAEESVISPEQFAVSMDLSRTIQDAGRDTDEYDDDDVDHRDDDGDGDGDGYGDGDVKEEGEEEFFDSANEHGSTVLHGDKHVAIPRLRLDSMKPESKHEDTSGRSGLERQQMLKMEKGRLVSRKEPHLSGTGSAHRTRSAPHTPSTPSGPSTSQRSVRNEGRGDLEPFGSDDEIDMYGDEYQLDGEDDTSFEEELRQRLGSLSERSSLQGNSDSHSYDFKSLSPRDRMDAERIRIAAMREEVQRERREAKVRRIVQKRKKEQIKHNLEKTSLRAQTAIQKSSPRIDPVGQNREEIELLVSLSESKRVSSLPSSSSASSSSSSSSKPTRASMFSSSKSQLHRTSELPRRSTSQSRVRKDPKALTKVASKRSSSVGKERRTTPTVVMPLASKAPKPMSSKRLSSEKRKHVEVGDDEDMLMNPQPPHAYQGTTRDTDVELEDLEISAIEKEKQLQKSIRGAMKRSLMEKKQKEEEERKMREQADKERRAREEKLRQVRLEARNALKRSKKRPKSRQAVHVQSEVAKYDSIDLGKFEISLDSEKSMRNTPPKSLISDHSEDGTVPLRTMSIRRLVSEVSGRSPSQPVVRVVEVDGVSREQRQRDREDDSHQQRKKHRHRHHHHHHHYHDTQTQDGDDETGQPRRLKKRRKDHAREMDDDEYGDDFDREWGIDVENESDGAPHTKVQTYREEQGKPEKTRQPRKTPPIIHTSLSSVPDRKDTKGGRIAQKGRKKTHEHATTADAMTDRRRQKSRDGKQPAQIHVNLGSSGFPEKKIKQREEERKEKTDEKPQMHFEARDRHQERWTLSEEEEEEKKGARGQEKTKES